VLDIARRSVVQHLRFVSKKNTLALVAITGLGALIGCSGGPSESQDTGTSAEELAVDTELPEALGGSGDSSAMASSDEPKVLHAYGLDGPIPTGDAAETATSAAEVEAENVGVAASLDISKYAPHVGNQGQFSDCVDWAEGHSSMAWWTKKKGRSGTPFNPLFLYSLVTGEKCTGGSTLSSVASLLKSKGDAPHADYAATTCHTPSKSQLSAASKHETSNYRYHWPLDKYYVCGPPRFPHPCAYSNENAIRLSLPDGPIVLGIQVYSEFENANDRHYIVGMPGKGSKYFGNHAVTVMKYDTRGVWIQNQWGTSWGKNGWALLTWAFINSGHTFDALQLEGLK
jgi:hypothetical protein